MIVAKTRKDFLFEIALHEASHFVTYFQLKQSDKRLGEVERVSVCIETMDNEVRQGMPGCAPDGIYKGNEQVLRFKLINQLAGYCSFALFSGISEHIYSRLISKDGEICNIEYLSFEDFCDEPYLKIKEFCCDVGTVKQYLFNYDKGINGKWKERYYELVNDTYEYLSKPEVKEAVDYSTQYILEKGCADIVGEELSSLIGIVEKIIK